MVVGPALPCSVPDFHVIVQEAVCSTTCWWLRSVGSTMHGPNWWHRYSLRSRMFRHPTRHHGRPLRTWARSLSPRNMAFRRASCCTVCLCNRMREAVWTCNSPSATKWCCAWRNCMDAVPKRSTRLGYVINARRSCSGWPAPARGLPSDPLRR